MSTLQIEEIASSFSQYLYDFIDSRPWDSAACSFEMARGYGSIREVWLVEKNLKIDKVSGWDQGNPKWGDEATSAKAIDLAMKWADEHLRATGQRIWGLTFTLYPSGKFKIDYDYTRPDWYTVADEQADMAAEQSKQSSNDVEALALRLNSLGASADVSKVAANPANAFFEQSLAWLRTQTIQLEHAWGLGSETEWALDLNAGILSLTFADDRVEHLPIQIVGTFNTNNESFLWAWDHPSIPVQLRKAAEQLQRYGVEHGHESLTTRQIHCSETDAWIYTAAAANLNKAVGAYRGKSGDTWVYMCLFK